MPHSMTPKKYYDVLHQSAVLEISYFLVYHMSRYLVYMYLPRYVRFSMSGPNLVFSSPL